MINYTCPTPDRWTALLGDELSADEQLDMQGHLDNCPECQRVLETCAADRAAWSAVPRWLGSCSDSDAKLQTVIERLKNSLDDATGETDMTLDFLDPSERGDSFGRLNSYEIIEEIGRGGMGIVLKALDPALHRVVAIKVLAPQLAVSGSARKRFTREARAAAAVCHEHVVTIHAVEEFKTLPYLVMHSVAGQSLQQKLDSHGPLPVADILRIGMQAAAGLAAAHAQGLVHRDIKPANILLENGVERVRLTDFGLARAIDDVGVTSSGVITGTPQYMAPEQARGDPLDARADLFSLGSVLYAMCTGEAPFHGSHALDVLRKVGEQQPQPIREVNYEIPAWLEAIVVKLMAKDPSQRFGSAAEVAELLERCLAHVQNPSAELLPTSIPRFTTLRRSVVSRWAALVLPILGGLFVVTEATGTTHMMKALGTILRFKTPEGTLVVEIDDPAVKVTLDDKDLVITGAGAQEVRVKPGSHTVRAMKDGQTKSEIVSIEKDGRATVKVSFETDMPRLPPVAKGARPAQPPFVKDLPRFTLDFRNEPWSGVFEGLSKLTELPVNTNAKPTGTFTFKSPVADDGRVHQYSLGEVIDIVNEALMQQHFLLVRRSKDFIVVPTDKKIDYSLFMNVPSYELEQRGKTELVNYIIRLEHVRGVDARAELQKLLSPIGIANTIPGGGLSISDKAENVRRVVQALTDLERRESEAPGPFGGKFSSGNQLPSETRAEKQFTFEMRDQPWSKVFDWLNEVSGLPVIANTKPTGTFTFAPALAGGKPRQYALNEVFDILNDALLQQHFLLVKRRNNFVLVPADEKIDPRYYRRITLDELPKCAKTELVDTEYKLGRLQSADIRPVLDKMVSQFGMAQTGMPPGTLTIRGTAANVREIVRVLRELENGPSGGAFAPDTDRKSDTAKPANLPSSPDGGPAGQLVSRPRFEFPVQVNNNRTGVFGAAITPDGKRVITSNSNGTATIWDAASGKLIGNLSGLEIGRCSLAISPDGALVAIGGRTHGQIRFLDTATGSVVQQLEGPRGVVQEMAFSPDGKMFTSASSNADGDDSEARLWRLHDGGTHELKDLGKHTGTKVTSVAFSPSGDSVISGYAAGQVIEVRIEDGKLENGRVLNVGAPVRCIAIEPKRQLMAVAHGEDGQVGLWSLDKPLSKPKRIATIRAHAKPISALAFSPDGKLFVTASTDGAAKVWDVATVKLVATFTIESAADALESAVFSPDGKEIITAGQDGIVRFWAVPSVHGHGETALPSVRVDPSLTGPKFTFEFHDEPWSAVLDSVSKLANLSVVAPAKPPGTFSFIPPKQVQGKPREFTLTEIIDILNDSLIARNFLLLRKADSLTLIPVDEKIDPNNFALTKVEELPQRAKTELVMVVFRLQHMRSADAVETIKPMFNYFGKGGFQDSANALILCDTAENVRRIVALLSELDRPGGLGPARNTPPKK